MDAGEYLGWQIRFETEPDTLERRDYMMALAAAPHYGKKPTDLMPWHRPETIEPQAVANKVFFVFGGISQGFEAQEEAKRNR